MRLYAGTSRQFIEDSTRNEIAEKLREAFFFHMRFEPSPGEVVSWRNSLRALAQTFTFAELFDHGVILEYQVPLMSLRLDCLVAGVDGSGTANAVIVEMKQWERCRDAPGPNEVLSAVGGALRELLHPSVQVERYRLFLEDVHTVFYADADPVKLHACAYLHNYHADEGDPLRAAKFQRALESAPAFCADEVPEMRDYLRERLEGGRGADVLRRIEQSEYRPSKKLMEHVAGVVKGNSDYVLIDEQLVVYDKVLTCASDGFHDRKKQTVIVKGGPGTGKSVIALNLMADLMLKGYNANYATGSKAFTQTLRKIIGTRGSQQFKYFNSFADAERDQVDVLIADESHRIREASHNRFTPAAKRTGLPQIEELLNAARVSVFFIDDVQVVRPNEIGSVRYIRERALERGHEVHEYQLDVQFRCRGSDGFINWVDNTLGIRRTANVLWNDTDEFDFRIFKTPEEVEAAIGAKVLEGNTGRMTAGFCWPWSDPDTDGQLIDDVVVGDYRRPWNAKSEAGRLAPGIPKESMWAYESGGIDQIGCIYTAQGFEFDYAGVIWGNDLRYSPDRNDWADDPRESFDTVVKRSGAGFLALVKNTYRVLLTRGMKGCYVCFLDKNTENFVRSRMGGKAVTPVES